VEILWSSDGMQSTRHKRQKVPWNDVSDDRNIPQESRSGWLQQRRTRGSKHVVPDPSKGIGLPAQRPRMATMGPPLPPNAHTGTRLPKCSPRAAHPNFLRGSQAQLENGERPGHGASGPAVQARSESEISSTASGSDRVLPIRGGG
jgi:hypothetical protein